MTNRLCGCFTRRSNGKRIENTTPLEQPSAKGRMYVDYVILRLLEYCGVCGPNRRSPAWYGAPVIYCIVFMVLPGFISLRPEDSLQDSMKKLGQQLYLVGAIFNFSVLAWNNDKLCLLVEKLEKVFHDAHALEDSKEYCQLILKTKMEIDRVTRWYVIYYGTVSYLSFVLRPMVITFWDYFTGATDFIVSTPTGLGANDFYFEYSSSLWRICVFYVLQLPAISYMERMVLLDVCFIICLAKYVRPVFEVTIARLRRLNKSQNVRLRDQPEKFEKTFIGIVEMHNIGLECVTLVESICHIIFLSYEIVFIINLCFIMFASNQYSNDFPADKVIGFLVVALGKMLFVSHLGSQLTVLSDQLSQEVYNIKWYDAPVSLRKSILMMLQQSQRRVGVTAGKYHHVDMESFSLVIQTSYSFYVVLKKMYTDEVH